MNIFTFVIDDLRAGPPPADPDITHVVLLIQSSKLIKLPTVSSFFPKAPNFFEDIVLSN